MKKLSPKSLNDYIDSIRGLGSEKDIKISGNTTNEVPVFIDYNKMVSTMETLEDLLRQSLPFFSTKDNIGFPNVFFMQLGGKDENGEFKYWTKSIDDLMHFMLLGINAGILGQPKMVKAKNQTGEEKEVQTFQILKKLKPAIVKESVNDIDDSPDSETKVSPQMIKEIQSKYSSYNLSDESAAKLCSMLKNLEVVWAKGSKETLEKCKEADAIFALGEKGFECHKRVVDLLYPNGNLIKKKKALKILNSMMHEFGAPLSRIDFTTAQGVSAFQDPKLSESFPASYYDKTIIEQMNVIYMDICILHSCNESVISQDTFDCMFIDEMKKRRDNKLAYSYYLTEKKD